MAIMIGDVVEHGAKALGSAVDQFLREIEVFATPPNGRSEFSKTMNKDYRSGSKIRCTWQFAAAVLDFLDSSKITNDDSFRRVHKDCMDVLADAGHRSRRYSFFVTDVLPGSERTHRLAGVYVVVRQETGDGNKLRQELLVLDHAGAGDRPGRTFGTLITPEIITRGVWTTSEKTLTYLACGRKRDYSIGFAAMEFVWPDDRRDVFGGILCGTSTNEGWPVVLPLLAIKIPDVTSRLAWQALCDRPDAELRREFAGCGRYKKEPTELKEIFDAFELHKDSRVMGAGAMIAPLRALGKELGSFVLPGVREFVEQKIVEPAVTANS